MSTIIPQLYPLLHQFMLDNKYDDGHNIDGKIPADRARYCFNFDTNTVYCCRADWEYIDIANSDTWVGYKASLSLYPFPQCLGTRILKIEYTLLTANDEDVFPHPYIILSLESLPSAIEKEIVRSSNPQSYLFHEDPLFRYIAKELFK